eukprot:superscaffoldBa00000403_g4441
MNSLCLQVLLAAAVCTKAGKAIVSRQFVEMTRTRIEGLLAAFPKLMNTGKQHTFVETDSVRYVYQPLEKLYMVLITTKNSNILEDLETLRLFSRVIPEYCRVLEESEISEHCFDLIFAFDEIVALGYRENVNLAQIRTFTEMDSHEEKVFRAVRETQEREAKAEMRRKAKELQQARRDAERSGKKVPAFGGFGSAGMTSVSSGSIITDTIVEPEKPKITPAPVRPSGPSKALKLGAKGKEVDNFVDKLNVHLRVEEKISLTCGRDGGLQNMEVLGMVTLRVTDDKNGRIRLIINNNDNKGLQLQTHPNVDKKLFTADSVIGLKNPEKSFPLNNDVGVLKWRLQTTDESLIPLTINCWPSESGTGCDVNIEYELQEESLELNDVVISIPVPSGVGAPVIGDLDGEYKHDSRRNILEWCLPVIDANNKTGSLEFSIAGQPNDFFPINVSFVSKRNYCDIQVTKVTHVDGDGSVRFSSETSFVVDKYEILSDAAGDSSAVTDTTCYFMSFTLSPVTASCSGRPLREVSSPTKFTLIGLSQEQLFAMEPVHLDNWRKDLHVSQEAVDNPVDMDRLNRNMPESGRQTHQVLQSTPLDLIETGKGLKFQAERPHLVSLGSGRLSTAITLLPLPEGRTTLGHGPMDISIQGPGVAAQHCYIDNRSGVITLNPCGNLCAIDGLQVTQPVRLSQGCMLCFGQSAFFRFNHPEEAFRMKSMMPHGGSVSTGDYRLCADTESLVNGNHQGSPVQSPPAPGERVQSEHSAIVSSIEKDLQDIMDSLVMDDPQPSSSEAKKPPGGQPIPHSPLSPMVNGGGRYLLSPPTSPGAMSVGSSYENTSPPFSPLSSPSAASSGSFTSPSPSGGPQDQSSSLPPVPVRSSSYNFTTQPPPVPQPRTILPNYGSSGAGQKVQESPRLQRKVLAEAPPSPKPSRRGLGQDGSESPRLLSSNESLSSRNIVPSSPRLTPKFPTSPSPSPTSPRTKNTTTTVLQERPASPFREQTSLADRSLTSSPSRQLSQPTRAFQPPLDPIVHIIQGSPLQQHPRSLQPPESPRMSRRNMELNGGSGGSSSMRELPPLSPSMARRGVPVLPGALPGTIPTLRTPDSPSGLNKVVPESPRLRRKTGSTSEEPVCSRGIRARSPSPTSLMMEGGGGGVGVRKASFGNSLSPAYSLGSLPGSSPVSSPRSHRKMSAGRPHPGMRERKNSITEISDNEDELLEYHRRQREERLREQEMERLVSEEHISPGNYHDSVYI